MNPYIGDLLLDPPEDDEPDECEQCGWRFDCSACAPDMTDPGEPNEEPDL